MCGAQVIPYLVDNYDKQPKKASRAVRRWNQVQQYSTTLDGLRQRCQNNCLLFNRDLYADGNGMGLPSFSLLLTRMYFQLAKT